MRVRVNVDIEKSSIFRLRSQEMEEGENDTERAMGEDRDFVIELLRERQ